MMRNKSDYRIIAITWRETSDPHFPYEALVDGQRVVLRLNDFPDYPSLYTLMIGATEIQEVQDWPTSWRRPRKSR